MFMEGLLTHLGLTSLEEYFMELKNLRKNGSLQEYQVEFEQISSRITDIWLVHLLEPLNDLSINFQS